MIRDDRLDNAKRVMQAWIAAEVLEPLKFRKIEDIVPKRKDTDLFPIFKNKILPWEDDYDVDPYPEGYAGFKCYDLILGTVDLKKSSMLFNQVYGQPFGEEGTDSGIAMFATLRVNALGYITQNGFNISSYGWGLIKALDRNIDKLADWPFVETNIQINFSQKFSEYQAKENQDFENPGVGDKKVTLEIVQEIYYWMLDLCQATEMHVNRPAKDTDLIIKPYAMVGHYKELPQEYTDRQGMKRLSVPDNKEPEALILNSFYLKDLINAHLALEESKQNSLLSRYMGIDEPPQRINILEDHNHLDSLLKPTKFPLGKWPASGRASLVTLQQAAINYTLTPAEQGEVNEDGEPIGKLTSINGPPGTGKTTLFKDLVAGIIVERAMVMVSYGDPSHAFRFNRKAVGYQMDDKLKGFEVIVASSNNNAVNNVSAEWPDSAALADDSTMTYLPATAKKLHKDRTWGAISAALGNYGNKMHFLRNFWTHAEYGMRAHLSHASGKAPMVVTPAKGMVPEARRPPLIVAEHDVPSGRTEALVRWREAVVRFKTIQKQVQDLIDKVSVAADHRSLDYSHHARLHTTSPWFVRQENRLREDLFEAAIHVHRCFLDGAAMEMTGNLSNAMDMIKGNFPSNPESSKNAFSSLFLAVPVLSTTFASVSRMMGNMPKSSIGWLLIDEAGQATPQSAVGIIARSKNAVIVGDPIQVTPIVGLNSFVITEIAKTFDIEQAKYMAPEASVQTVADNASEYYAEYPDDGAIRKVGMPLLIHRRCSEPMFSISNEIGYGGLMVSAKTPKPSAIRDVAMQSRWIDVQDTSTSKWSEKEGDIAIKLLKLIIKADGLEDFYIITPFRDIEWEMKSAIYKNRRAMGLSEADMKTMQSRVGTIHKIQGREADTVILMLGAQGDKNKRARMWAGGTPNILNVAVTRAKENLYVIGNRQEWRDAGYFHTLERHIGQVEKPTMASPKAA
jgi:hypothetical protein